MSRDAAFSPVLKKKSADLRFTWYRIDSTKRYKNEKDSNMKKIIVIGGGRYGGCDCGGGKWLRGNDL